MNAPLPPPPPIEDIVGPLAAPTPAWLVGLWTALALLGLGGVIWLVRRAFRRPAPAPPSPIRVLEQQLDRLSARASTLDPRTVAVEASEALRSYLAAVEPALNRSRTTEEFLREAAAHPRFDADRRRGLADFLRTADRVKFAGATLDPEAARALLAKARDLAAETRPTRDPAEPVSAR